MLYKPSYMHLRARGRRDIVANRALELKRSLRGYARSNLYVTGSGMWSEAYLRQCLKVVGPDRLPF